MTAATKIPDVNGLIRDLNNPELSEQQVSSIPSHPDIISEKGPAPRDTLWNDFRSVLNKEPEIVGRKCYYIDNDLLDTIDQCDFEGISKVNIINAIIRTFLEANVAHLHNIRKKKPYDTILDKYAKKHPQS